MFWVLSVNFRCLIESIRLNTYNNKKWGDKLSTAKKIRILLIEREITLTELSRRLNITAPTMSDKLKRDNFSEKDLKKIADALNFDYEAVFTDRETGKTI